MRNSIIILFGILTLALSSCNKDIDGFDNSTNFIYFNMPFQLDQYGRETTKRVDSLTFSFAMSDNSVTTHTFKIPISIVGLAANGARDYSVVVDTENSTAKESDWDKKSIENLTIKPGALHDTILLVVNRTEALKNSWRSITLKIMSNNNFTMGAEELTTAKVAFTDILQPPTWWNTWLSIFGEFSREKYVKWQEIYYLGADPNLEEYGPNVGKQLYWGQMPYYVMASWYPSTWMFIGKLRNYFAENVVYPNGDTSKPRIYIP